MKNKTLLLMPLILNLASCLAYAKQPITLFIPQAYANDINSKNYVVPDLVTNANNNPTASQTASNTNINFMHETAPKPKPKKLIAKEQNALNLSSKFYNVPASVIQGKNGAVTFIYGQSQPTIICAVMRICMLELQAGEIIQDEKIGDSLRWEVTPTASTIPYISIKPLSEGYLETNYIIITNKRRYAFTLKSGISNQYMSLVNFIYSDNAQEQWAKYYKLQKLKQKEQQINTNNTYSADAENFDFNYSLHGNAPFKPTQIYTDGKKTYIKLPASVTNSELPIFHAETSTGKLKAVNARFLDNTYIIDQKIERGRLKAGSGDDKQEILITYSKANKLSYNNER